MLLTSDPPRLALRGQDGRIYKVGNITRYSQYKDMIEFPGRSARRMMFRSWLSARKLRSAKLSTRLETLGMGIAFRGGQIASYTLETKNGRFKVIRYSAPSSPGNSGGPLVDTHGRVVGITVAGIPGDNLNVAMRILDFDSLSSEAAEFEQDIKMKRGTKDFGNKLESGIPASRSDRKGLAAQAQKSRNEAELALVKEMFTPGNMELEPAPSRLCRIFRALPCRYRYVFFGLRLVGAEHWQYYTPKFNRVALETGGNAYFFGQALEGVNHGLLQPTPTKKMDQFLATHPAYVLDQLLKTGFLRRTIGDESIRITTLGEPLRTARWKDDLGRTWISSNWDAKFNNGHVESNCLMPPDGVACQLLYASYSTFRPGTEMYFHKMDDNINFIYRGTVMQWWDYINLQKDLVSPALRKHEDCVDEWQPLLGWLRQRRSKSFRPGVHRQFVHGDCHVVCAGARVQGITSRHRHFSLPEMSTMYPPTSALQYGHRHCAFSDAAGAAIAQNRMGRRRQE